MDQLIIPVWIVCLLAGGIIGAKKGQLAGGIILAFIGGPIGVLITLLVPAKNVPSVPVGSESPPAIPAKSVFRVARGGEDIGEFPLSSIVQMMKAGMLSANDYYLHPVRNEWLPLADLSPA